MNTKIITATLMLGLALVGLPASAQTNTVTVTNYVTITNTITAPAVTLGNSGHMPMDEAKAKGWPMELTLGAGGITVPGTGQTEFGFNFTLSAQPLSVPIWFGISQELGWEPTLAGATDLYADWSWALVKEKLYLNTGWSVGTTYDRETLGWRSGPEISLEYYTTGNAFIFVGANYDLFTRDSAGSWHTAEGSSGLNNLRYSAGIGIAF